MLENLESEFKDGKLHFYMWNDVSLELLDFTFNEAIGYAENLQEAKRKLSAWFRDLPDYEKRNLEAQAKATWEARQKEVDEAEQRGIRKVVDWLNGLMIKQRDACAPGKYSLVLVVDNDKWQAQLKEWGI